MKTNNIDLNVVHGFGDEWERFDQSKLTLRESTIIFNKYFSNFPWSKINENSIGFDLGCGSGRWAKLMAPKVGHLHLIDPSSAIDVAKSNLADFKNCTFHKSSVDFIDLEDSSMDFGYSLGVLHHIPNTKNALISCVRKLKPGAPFLIYLYYNFDNKPKWYRTLWFFSEIFRKFISKTPHNIRYFLSQLIAV
jgi:ubiquinone/menaquinone biosynthesis C-methylase UbiE